MDKVKGATIKALIGILGLLWCGCAWAEPDYEALSSAIRLAEGNSNYGVLTHYKHTSYKQACINTCKHAYRDWLKIAPRAYNSKFYDAKMSYLTFLANRYAPRRVANDPKNLNKNWLKNVSQLYKGKI